MEQDNRLNFTPHGFQFFDKALHLYEALSEKLEEEIAFNRPKNEFEKHFINENTIQAEIINLGAKTDIDKLKEIANYSEADELSLSQLIAKWNELKALDIPKKIAELQKLQVQLTEFTARQQAILDVIKPEDTEHYRSLIASFHKFQELARQEGIESLKDYEIAALGSNEWREFIKASRAYATAIDKSRDNRNEYPDQPDTCLFCLQPLTSKESTLINSYWKLLKSEAQAELNRIIQKIQEKVKILKGLAPAKFDESTTLVEYINSIDPALATRWKELVSNSEIVRQTLIECLSTRTWQPSVTSFTVSTTEFDQVAKRIADSIEDLINKNPEKESEELESQINFLKDKSLLSKLLDKILMCLCH